MNLAGDEKYGQECGTWKYIIYFLYSVNQVSPSYKLFLHAQHTERKYEAAFANAHKASSSSDSAAGRAGGAGVDTEGFRKDTHGNINQV